MCNTPYYRLKYAYAHNRYIYIKLRSQLFEKYMLIKFMFSHYFYDFEIYNVVLIIKFQIDFIEQYNTLSEYQRIMLLGFKGRQR